jgi:large subunit ribosomal protein L13
MNFTKNNFNTTLLVKPEDLVKARIRRSVDASGMTLGRLAVEIAKKLIGKHKNSYTDFWDAGDYVIVTNTSKLVVTGNKNLQKMYYRHSGHKGHLKETNFKDLMQKNPNEVLKLAVK